MERSQEKRQSIPDPLPPLLSCYIAMITVCNLGNRYSALLEFNELQMPHVLPMVIRHHKTCSTPSRTRLAKVAPEQVNDISCIHRHP